MIETDAPYLVSQYCDCCYCWFSGLGSELPKHPFTLLCEYSLQRQPGLRVGCCLQCEFLGRASNVRLASTCSLSAHSPELYVRFQQFPLHDLRRCRLCLLHAGAPQHTAKQSSA